MTPVNINKLTHASTDDTLELTMSNPSAARLTD
jgi:hypothetical protein